MARPGPCKAAGARRRGWGGEKVLRWLVLVLAWLRGVCRKYKGKQALRGVAAVQHMRRRCWLGGRGGSRRASRSCGYGSCSAYEEKVLVAVRQSRPPVAGGERRQSQGRRLCAGGASKALTSTPHPPPPTLPK
eukprot:scaffold33835_cov101-Isochrysis_galbana.AAC.1